MARSDAVGTSAGTDIVAIDRIAALVDSYGQRFLNRWFTAGEIEYCMAKAAPSRHLAARLAGKEAVVKALPPWDGPLPWRSIEITNDARGAPSAPRRPAPRSVTSRCRCRTATTTPRPSRS
jgi:holo-[acyl-carrier-protein] synthase